MKLRTALLASVLTMGAHTAHSWPVHGSGGMSICLTGSNALDGCLAAPYGTTGNFSMPGFFSQFSQAPTSVTMAHTPISDVVHNVAGVSPGYNLGNPSKAFVGNLNGTTLTYISGAVPAVNDTLDEGCGNDSTSCFIAQGTHIISGSSPTFTMDVSYGTPHNNVALNAITYVSPDSSPGGCSYAVSGAYGTQQLTCAAGATLTLVDFSPSNKCLTPGANCTNGKATFLSLTGSSVVYSLNYIKMGMDAAQQAGTHTAGGGTAFLGKANGTGITVNMNGGIFDLCGIVDAYCTTAFNNYANVSGTYPSVMFNNTSTGSWIRKYGVYLNVDGRFFANGHAGSGDVYEADYNFICGMVFGTNASHGEFEIEGPDAVSYSFKYRGNTVCQPATATTNQDGVQVVANTYTTHAWIDGITAGQLSALKVPGVPTPQKISNGPSMAGVAAATTLSDYGTGTTGASCTGGSTAALATCILDNQVASSTTSGAVMIYGGTGSGNATTSMFAPWGGNTSAHVTSLTVDLNTIMVNQAPNFGGAPSSCTFPGGSMGAAGAYCGATAGTCWFELEFDSYDTPASIQGNYAYCPGSYYWYSNLGTSGAVNGILSGASISGGVLTASTNTIPIGAWITDAANQSLGGGAPLTSAVQVTGAPGGVGPYTYTLSGSPPNLASETMYARSTLTAAITAHNVNMYDGTNCDPPTITGTGPVCTGNHAAP